MNKKDRRCKNGHPIDKHKLVLMERVVGSCDVLFCDFTGSKKALIGQEFELAWAHLWGKPTIIVVPEGNIHQHAFILEASDICFKNTGDALDYLKHLIEGKIE